MPNITISLDEELVKLGRQYAQLHQTSLNNLIRKLLEETVGSPSSDWLDQSFRIMDQTHANSRGRRWTRADLYDV